MRGLFGQNFDAQEPVPTLSIVIDAILFLAIIWMVPSVLLFGIIALPGGIVVAVAFRIFEGDTSSDGPEIVLNLENTKMQPSPSPAENTPLKRNTPTWCLEFARLIWPTSIV
jgi:hypothetical protein